MDELLKSLLSVTAIIIGTGLMLWITNRIFQKKQIFFKQHVFTRALIMMSIVVAGIIGILLTLPIAEGSRTTLMTVMGLVISAAITLSSTTFVGNAMAGFLLRIIRLSLTARLSAFGSYCFTYRPFTRFCRVRNGLGGID